MKVTPTPGRSLVAALVALLLGGSAASADTGPLLVVLTETGQVRQGRPVLALHPSATPTLSALSRGLPGRMLRLYRYEQQYLHQRDGRAVEPAYLLLSTAQGGFPRFGFVLGGIDKPEVGYVDIHRSKRISGVFGALDQIFPHELAHVFTVQLAGEAAFGGSNQTHGNGLRTDPSVAFEEGFAEHFQVLAVDDLDALPDTRALARDAWQVQKTDANLVAYTREVLARWSPFTPRRLGFLFWFSGAEQVLRYHAVKVNRYARVPDVPDEALTPGDPYAGYLLQSVLPGEANGKAKSAAVMLSTEGVVASLFWRWVTDQGLQQRYRDAAFYAAFGASPGDVTPFENTYLKLFHAWYLGKPHSTQAAIAAYKAAFPDEAPDVDRVVGAGLLGQALPSAPGIWLANDAFRVGTTLYDQYRGSPRVHTFDLNAATLVDLVSVEGVDRALAGRILSHAPYVDLAAFGRVPGMSPALMLRFEAMSRGMDRLRSEKSGEPSFMMILRPLLVRAACAVLLAGIAGGWLYRLLARANMLRALINGFAAALVSLVLAWAGVEPPWLASVIVPWMLFGVPAALWRLWRNFHQQAVDGIRPRLSPVRVLTAWAAAVLPAVFLTVPMF